MVSLSRKIALSIGIALVLTFAAVVLAAHLLISRQDHQLIKQELAAGILASTGFELQIRGPIELPYSLRPTIVFQDVVLNHPETGGDDNLLEAEEFHVTIAALPLVRGEVLIYDITMSGVNLNLEVGEGGQENWMWDDTPVGTTSPKQLVIHSIALENVGLTYANLQTGIAFGGRIGRLSVWASVFTDDVLVELLTEHRDYVIALRGDLGSMEDFLVGQSIPFDVDVDIDDIDVELTGRIDRGEVSGFSLRLEADGEDLSDLEDLLGLSIPETNGFSITTTLSALEEEISASDILAEIDWQGSEMKLGGRIADIRNRSGLDIDVGVIGDDLSDISQLLNLASLPQTDSYELSGNVRGDWSSIEIHGASASLRQDDETLDASGRIGDVAALSDIDIVFDVRGGNLNGLSRFVGQKLSQTQTYRLSGTLVGSWPTLSLSAASASLTRESVTIELAGSVDNLADRSGVNLDVSASGSDLSLIPELSTLALPAIDSFRFTGKLTGSPSRFSMQGVDAAVELGPHRLDLSGAVVDIAELDGMNFILTAAGDDLSTLNTMLGLDLPPTISYRLSSTLAGNADSLSARDLVFEGSATGVRFDIRGDIDRVSEMQGIDLSLLINLDKMSRLSYYFGPDLPQSEPIEMAGRFTGSAPDLNVAAFTVKSGASLVVGSGSLRTGERFSITGSVTSGVLDMRPYIVAARDEAQSNVGTRVDRWFSDTPFDFTYLDTYDAQLRLDNLEILSTAGNFLVKHASIELQQGSLSIEPMELVRDDTTIIGSFRLDRQSPPEFETDLSIENVDLATFLQDIRTRDAYEGRFDLALDLRAQGNSVRELMANLNGEVSAFMSEARFPNSNLPLRTSDFIFDALPWLKRRADTNVKCAISQLAIDDGVVDIKLLYLDAAQMRMIGGGEINLRTEELDLRLSPRRKGSRILAHNIDLTVGGILSEPKYSRVGVGRAVATGYGMYALLGPLGLLVPTGISRRHPCAGSLQEYRQQRVEEE